MTSASQRPPSRASRRRVALAAALTLALAGVGPVAHAQTTITGFNYGNILPRIGADARVGDLRPQLQSFLNPTESLVRRPAYLIQPAIEVDVGITDNALRTSANQRADVFTIISPSIVASADTSRLTVNLAYNPQITIYADDSSQSQISQFFNGQATAIVVRDTLFVDLRGSITESSLTNGGFVQGNTQSFNTQNTVETIAVSVSPYVQHHFGGWGDGELRYTLARTLQEVPNTIGGSQANFQGTAVNPSLAAYGQPGFGSIGNLTTQTESGVFTTGENLGRYNDTITGSATQYSGGGSYRGAYRQSIQNELGYALTRTVTLLGGIGYETINYGGNPGYHLSEATYDVGVRYTPNPDTTITIEYGRYDGGNQISFNGQAAITPRLRVVARYSTGITTDLEQAQSLLNTSNVSAAGLVTDRTTGAPVTSNSFVGVQNGVYRDRIFSASLFFLQDRDSYSLSITNEQRTSLTTTPTVFGNGLVPAGTSTNSTYGTASWAHEISPVVTFTAIGSYGITSSSSQFGGSGNQNTQTVSLTAALSRQFTETLSGSLRYTFVNQTGAQLFNTGFNNNSGNYSQNTILVGLRKSF